MTKEKKDKILRISAIVCPILGWIAGAAVIYTIIRVYIIGA